MSTLWFERHAGEMASRGVTDPSSFIIGADVPDWVRMPAELGGAKVKVEGAVKARCVCSRDHDVRHIVLADSEVHVAECPIKGFLWYKFPNEEE